MQKRVTLTPKQKAQKRLDQKGKCAKCKFDLMEGDIEYDHRVPIWKRGNEVYTKEEEYALQDALCGLCHKHKTRKEAAERAHHNRLERARLALVDGVPKPAKRNGSKMQSPGFRKHPTLKQQIGTGKMVPRKEKT